MQMILGIKPDALRRAPYRQYDPRTRKEQFLYPYTVEDSCWYAGEYEIYFQGCRTGRIVKDSAAAAQIVESLNAKHIADSMVRGDVFKIETSINVY